MTFTGREDHSITLEGADQGAIKAGFFGKDALQGILDQEGCVGIRVYYGEDDNGTPQLVLVGADADTNDIIEGNLAQRQVPCPPYCGKDNELNS